MTDFTEKPTKIGRLIVDNISLRCRIVQIRLALKDENEEIILNLQDIYYLSNNLSNLISLSLLNDVSIFYDNKYHTSIIKQAKNLLLLPNNRSKAFYYVL